MSALNSPVDPLLRTAIRRDGLGNGRLRIEIAAGELVFVPWTFGQGGAGLQPTNNPFVVQNQDKSGTYILLESPAASWGVAYMISGYFRGRSFGVRFEPSQTSAAGTPVHSDFGVMIDRVGYRIPKLAFNPYTQAAQPDPDGGYGVIVTRDLAEGLHHFEIDTRVFAGNTTALYVLGLLLEKAAGYREPTSFSVRCNPYNLTTTNMTMLGGFASAFRTPRGITEVTYYNTTAGAISITWRLNAQDYYTFSLAAGESRSFSFNPAIAGNHYSVSANNYMHRASATGVVCTAVGI